MEGMKVSLIVCLTLSVIPVSIAGMVLGWGLAPASWGWISFSYLWMFLAPMFARSIVE